MRNVVVTTGDGVSASQFAVVAVGVGVGVRVEVDVGVPVGVAVAVGVWVDVGVPVGVAVAVGVWVDVGVPVGVAVAVGGPASRRTSGRYSEDTSLGARRVGVASKPSCGAPAAVWGIGSAALVCVNASTVSNTQIIRTGANERFLILLSFRGQDAMADKNRVTGIWGYCIMDSGAVQRARAAGCPSKFWAARDQTCQVFGNLTGLSQRAAESKNVTHTQRHAPPAIAPNHLVSRTKKYAHVATSSRFRVTTTISATLPRTRIVPRLPISPKQL
jgi:hypothetical protein